MDCSLRPAATTASARQEDSSWCKTFSDWSLSFETNLFIGLTIFPSMGASMLFCPYDVTLKIQRHLLHSWHQTNLNYVNHYRTSTVCLLYSVQLFYGADFCLCSVFRRYWLPAALPARPSLQPEYTHMRLSRQSSLLPGLGPASCCQG